MKFSVALIALIAISVLLVATPVAASDPVPSVNLQAQIGNYCLECHTAVPPRPLAVTRPVEWARDIPCATLRKGYEEIAQIDLLAAAYQNVASELRGWRVDTSAQDKRINARRVAAARIAETDGIALATITNQGNTARYQMNKAYATLQTARADRDRMIILIVVGLATVFIVSGIVLGWRNTRKGKSGGAGKPSSARGMWTATIIGMIVVFVLFAVPIFAFSPALPAATAEETARQTAVDQAARVSDAATKSSAQSWVLGQIGAQWYALDKTQANATFQAALQAAHDKGASREAYWGQTQAVQESAVAWAPAAQDLAEYRAALIENAAAQSWQYRALANEWLGVDKAKATEALQLALANLSPRDSNLQRDLELRALAVTWGKLDAAKGNELLAQISDPFVRAWGWREAKQYDQATQTARTIKANYDRAWALREIARAAGNAALFNDALAAANQIERTDTRAYAIADIAIAWASQDAAKAFDLIGKIDPAYAEARAMAWHGVGNALAATDAARARDAFGFAFDAAKKAGSPYQIEKWTAAILIDYARFNVDVGLDSATKLTDPVLREQVYLGVMPLVAAQNLDKALNVAERITSPALRARAFTALGVAALQAGDKTRAAAAFQNSFALADKLEDTFGLRDLAVAWSELDPKSALAVVDKLEDPADKTAALQAIALAFAPSDKKQSADAFDRALNVAKSAKVRGEPFAAARALAALGRAYAAIDPARANQAFTLALDVAKRVNVKY